MIYQRLLPIAITTVFGYVLGVIAIAIVLMNRMIMPIFARGRLAMVMRISVVMEMLRLSSQKNDC